MESSLYHSRLFATRVMKTEYLPQSTTLLSLNWSIWLIAKITEPFEKTTVVSICGRTKSQFLEKVNFWNKCAQMSKLSTTITWYNHSFWEVECRTSHLKVAWITEYVVNKHSGCYIRCECTSTSGHSTRRFGSRVGLYFSEHESRWPSKSHIVLCNSSSSNHIAHSVYRH